MGELTDKHDVVLLEDGEKTENLHRANIEEADREAQKTAIANNNTEERIRLLEKVIYGSEIHGGSE